MQRLALVVFTAAVTGCLAHHPETNAAPSGDESDTAAPIAVRAVQAEQDASPFAAWLRQMRDTARAEGIAADTLTRALDPAEYLPEVVERDRSQPEFTRQIWEYLDTAVSEARVSNGQTKLAAHQQAASEAQAQYGVPAEILVAIWGMESNYGSHFGNFRTIDALATLGFDGRRTAFARRELLAALKIIDSGDIDRDRMRGSWAGAMGHTQFLPSSFRAYAVDGDGDGRRDIWGSIPDVMASTAHYLARAGWDADAPWGAEVQLPPDFDYALIGRSRPQPTAAWQRLGVAPARGDRLPALEKGAVIAPAGSEGPAFLVGPNFNAILRYNNAISYALGVALLSERIAGHGPLQQDWPRHLAALSRDQIRSMQRLLNAQGFDAGPADGLVGPSTRAGVRAFQRAIGEKPDGFPTQGLLRRLRAYAEAT